MSWVIFKSDVATFTKFNLWPEVVLSILTTFIPILPKTRFEFHILQGCLNDMKGPPWLGPTSKKILKFDFLDWLKQHSFR